MPRRARQASPPVPGRTVAYGYRTAVSLFPDGAAL